jgi:hypothetical protein
MESGGGDTEKAQATKMQLRIIKGTGIQYFLISLASSCMGAAQAQKGVYGGTHFLRHLLFAGVQIIRSARSGTQK